LDVRFWENRNDWPPSVGDRLFLGEAVPIVGRSLFQATWSDADLRATLSGDRGADTPYSRLASVARWFAEQADAIPAFVSSSAGGEFFPVPSRIWNVGSVDNLLSKRLYRCGMHRDGGGALSSYLGEQPIFIERGAFAKAVRSHSSESRSTKALQSRGGRPKKHAPILAAFCDRLRQRLTSSVWVREQNQLIRAWTRGDPPSSDTVKRAAKSHFNELRFIDGRVTDDSAEQVLRSLAM
jgi:hypothetical protein